MNIAQLLNLQALAFPLIQTFGGPDIANDFIKPGGEYLAEGATVLREAADVLEVAGVGLADGRLTMDEIEAVLSEFVELKEAIAKLADKDPA